jgi:hypothetical protein
MNIRSLVLPMCSNSTCLPDSSTLSFCSKDARSLRISSDSEAIARNCSSSMSAVRVGENIAGRFLIRQFSTARTAMLLMNIEMALCEQLVEVKHESDGEDGLTDLVVCLHEIKDLRVGIVID